MTSEMSEIDLFTRVEQWKRMTERDAWEHEIGRFVESPWLPIDIIRINKS